AAIPASGAARPDWEIAQAFARRLAARLGRPQAAALFAYRSAEEIFDEHRVTTQGRDLDITGLTYAMLEERGPQQWPLPPGADGGRARPPAPGGYPPPPGGARFLAAPPRPPRGGPPPGGAPPPPPPPPPHPRPPTTPSSPSWARAPSPRSSCLPPTSPSAASRPGTSCG